MSKQNVYKISDKQFIVTDEAGLLTAIEAFCDNARDASKEFYPPDSEIDKNKPDSYPAHITFYKSELTYYVCVFYRHDTVSNYKHSLLAEVKRINAQLDCFNEIEAAIASNLPA